MLFRAEPRHLKRGGKFLTKWSSIPQFLSYKNGKPQYFGVALNFLITGGPKRGGGDQDMHGAPHHVVPEEFHPPVYQTD